MTVPAPGPLTYSYSEDGVTTIFPYPVRFIEAQELVVMRTVDGIATTLTMGVDYTVSGEGNPAGGSITRTAATNGGTITIYRDTTWKQLVDLEDKQRNPAQAVEDQLDRLTMAGQDARAKIGTLQDKTSDLDDAVARAEAAKVDAEAAKESAEDSAAAAMSAVPNAFPVDRAVMKVLDTNSIKAAYLKEPGREGQFLWQEGDYSTIATEDLTEGFYIKGGSIPLTQGAWVRSLSERKYVPEYWGAKGDTRALYPLAIDASSNQLAHYGQLSSADEGKLVIITGAGPGGIVPLVATVVSVGTFATLSTSAVSTVSDMPGYIGSDDTSALKSMVAHAQRGDGIEMRRGRYICTETLACPREITFDGNGASIIFPSSDGMYFDLRPSVAKGFLPKLDVGGIELISTSHPQASRVGLRITGAANGNLCRILVEDVTARGALDSFIYGSAWGIGIAGHNLAAAKIRACAVGGLTIDAAQGVAGSTGFYISNSTNVILEDSEVAFSEIMARIVCGDERFSAYQSTIGTESIRIRNNMFTFGRLGVFTERQNSDFAGTHYEISSNHIDVHHRPIIIGDGLDGWCNQSTIKDNKIHLSRPEGYVEPPIGIEVLSENTLCSENHILWYSGVVDENPSSIRTGIKMQSGAVGSSAIANTFIHATENAIFDAPTSTPNQIKNNIGRAAVGPIKTISANSGNVDGNEMAVVFY